MATRAAHKRLTREYALIQKSPPPYITAHPSETNILEWHYILTGPPDTPYAGGQYWGTLVFPPEYPFAPPAIRMHTPSGRFQPSTRLCLSISDFHPKSFNPAWEVSTILIGLLSFMTGEEMTTGSVSATQQERAALRDRTRWWNSTGGGSTPRTLDGTQRGKNVNGFGNVKAGDGGEKFRAEWPEVDAENWTWLRQRQIDPKTGRSLATNKEGASCTPGADALRRRPGAAGAGRGSNAALEAVRQQARDAVQQGWLGRHKVLVCVVALFGYAILARLLGDGSQQQASI